MIVSSLRSALGRLERRADRIDETKLTEKATAWWSTSWPTTSRKVPFTTIKIFGMDDLKRGDIVVLFSPVDGIRLVKRVGASRRPVEMRDNQLYINGQVAKQSPVATTELADYATSWPRTSSPHAQDDGHA